MEPWIKRFLVFAGAVDQPQGGWNDCAGSFDTLEEAHAGKLKKIVKVIDFLGLPADADMWWNIIDIYDESFGESSEDDVP